MPSPLKELERILAQFIGRTKAAEFARNPNSRFRLLMEAGAAIANRAGFDKAYRFCELVEAVLAEAGEPLHAQ